MLQSMESKRDMTEWLNWTELNWYLHLKKETQLILICLFWIYTFHWFFFFVISNRFLVKSRIFYIWDHVIRKMDNLIYPFWFGCLVFLFCLLLWLGLQILPWIEVVRMRILVLLLILKIAFWLFAIEYDVSCWLDLQCHYYAEVYLF